MKNLTEVEIKAIKKDHELVFDDTDAFDALCDMALESLKAPAVTTGEWRSIESAPIHTEILVCAKGIGWRPAYQQSNHEWADAKTDKALGFIPEWWIKISHPTQYLPQPPNSTTLSAPAHLSSEAVGTGPHANGNFCPVCRPTEHLLKDKK